MDESKVTLPLNEFLKLIENKYEKESKYQTLLALLFGAFETDSKGNFKFDKYNLRDEQVDLILHEIDEKRYELIKSMQAEKPR